METKSTETSNLNNVIEEEDNKNTYISILNKINHKPIIMESIYSFSQNRPYILLYLISNDLLLKSSMKNTFDNAKKVNNLSKDINDNINNYIFYRKILEILKEKTEKIISNIFKGELKLNSLIKNSKEVKSKNEILNDILNDIVNNSCYDMNIEVDFIDKNYKSIKNNLINIYYRSYMKQMKKNKSNASKKYQIKKPKSNQI